MAEGKAEGKAEGVAVGKAEGKAEGLLAVMAARGLAVSATTRKRVMACRDPAQLDRWLVRAATATTVKAVFG